MRKFFYLKTFKTILSLVFVLFVYNLSLCAQEQPESPLLQSYKVHSELKAKTNYGLEWIQLGPTLNGARAEAVTADPNKPGTLYIAFGSGGLWKSINNGMTWKPIFENMPSLGIGDIALAPSNPEIIYVGTGESLKKARNFTMPGTGIYRSNDGGETWSHLGLNDCWHIGEISVHPENPDIVLVAVQGHFWSSNTNRGIFRTEDGGKNWEHVLYLDEETGANDIVFSPKDPNIAYASMWQNFPGVNGAKSAIYTSEDAGKIWKKSVNGITINEGTGRIGVAASYQDKNKAYAFIDQRARELEDGKGEIYKTEDGGKNWERTHEDNIHSLASLGWYFMDINVNPQDDNEIYALGVGFIHSTDGGKNFDFIRGQINHISPSPAQTMHLDHCELWVNPLNPLELLLANDGGAYHSFDKGETWLHLNNIPTGEFYDIELDKKEPYNIYGGVQDDATVFGPSKEFNPKFVDKWEYLWLDAWSGGDGCITLVDPNNDNTVYFSMQTGGARRLDFEKGKSKSIRPRFKDEEIDIRYNFLTPYMLSPHNSNTVYMGGNYMMKSENRGDDWKIISPDFVALKNNPKEETGAGAIAESYFEEGTLYFGTDRGAVWRTKNSGEKWVNISNGLPENYIRCISPSKHKKNRIYLQQTGINYDDLHAYVYVSDDYGDTWESIKNNLPDHPVNCIVEDPKFENILYAGTYRGVYVSENFGKFWSYFGANLPDASIADIVIDEKSKDMVIATHGRGIYKLNLCPFYTKVNTDIAGNILFDPPNALFPKRRDTHRDIDENTVVKTPITFWLDYGEDVEIIITNLEDSILWSTQFKGRKGFNQYRWDLVTQVKKSDQAYAYRFKNYLPIGEYKLILKGLNFQEEKEFMVSDYSYNPCGIEEYSENSSYKNMRNVMHAVNFKKMAFKQFKKPPRNTNNVVSSKFGKKFAVEEWDVEGYKVLNISSKNSSNKNIVFLHGGAYILEATSFHRNVIKELVEDYQFKVTFIDYPKAPENTFEKTHQIVLSAYLDILEKYPDDEIYLFGDSAGGGLALAFLQNLKQKNITLPLKTVLMSPWLDISMENKEIVNYIPLDPELPFEGLIYAGKKYAGDSAKIKDPLLSPIYGDLYGLGNIKIFFGTHELFYPDCMKLIAKVQQVNGTNLEYEIGKNLIHDWILFPTKNAKDTLSNSSIF